MVIPGVFSADEVKDFRRVLAAKLATPADSYLRHDMLCDPELRSFLCDGRLAAIAGALLGARPVYFGDSSAMRYERDAKVGTFHKDNTDRLDPAGPDWKDTYPLLRFGLYMQDHSATGGGLMLRAGSHRFTRSSRLREVFDDEVIGWLSGRTRYVFAGLGDLVVWNMRTTHAGMGQYLRLPLRRPVSERAQRLVPPLLMSRTEDVRFALFASFGIRHPLLDRYLAYLRTRAYMVDIWHQTHYQDRDFRDLAAAGIELLDVPSDIRAEIAAGAPIGLKQRWEPFPY